MMRTTVDLDEPILRDLKKLQQSEGKTLGQLISELVASALAMRKSRRLTPKRFEWQSRAMGLRVDLSDKDAVHSALDDRSRETP